ncbi:hypothetical protein [Cupriavidus necator]
MHAFEQIIAEILEREGFWVQAGVKVSLTQAVKNKLGNSSMPRPEIDLVAYHVGSNTLALVECKSYFDSQGVVAADVIGTGKGKDRYKLFTNRKLRDEITKSLVHDFVQQGRSSPSPIVEYWLICGKIKSGNAPALAKHFRKKRPQQWRVLDRDWVAERLRGAADGKYENLVSTMVAKILT